MVTSKNVYMFMTFRGRFALRALVALAMGSLMTFIFIFVTSFAALDTLGLIVCLPKENPHLQISTFGAKRTTTRFSNASASQIDQFNVMEIDNSQESIYWRAYHVVHDERGWPFFAVQSRVYYCTEVSDHIFGMTFKPKLISVDGSILFNSATFEEYWIVPRIFPFKPLYRGLILNISIFALAWHFSMLFLAIMKSRYLRKGKCNNSCLGWGSLAGNSCKFIFVLMMGFLTTTSIAVWASHIERDDIVFLDILSEDDPYLQSSAFGIRSTTQYIEDIPDMQMTILRASEWDDGELEHRWYDFHCVLEERGWPFYAFQASVWYCDKEADLFEQFHWPAAIISVEGGFLPDRSVSWQNYRIYPFHPKYFGLIADSIFFSIPWYLIIFGPGFLLARYRRTHNRCSVCGYNLRGSIDSGCPECGWGRSESDVIDL